MKVLLLIFAIIQLFLVLMLAWHLREAIKAHRKVRQTEEEEKKKQATFSYSIGRADGVLLRKIKEIEGRVYKLENKEQQ